MLDKLSKWNENLLDEVIFEHSAERGDRESVDYLLHIWKKNDNYIYYVHKYEKE